MRDSFRDNLQARQQQRVEFAADIEQLFKPITTSTEKIAKRTKQVKKSLKTLPADIVAAQPEHRRIYRPGEIFTTTTLDEIKNISTEDELARYTVDTFKNKNE